MSVHQDLSPVAPQQGRPLYQTVRDTLQAAIDGGRYQPGEQMPSTKELSRQMSVSLVTAHRALQELVASGILQRSQGRGTFVRQQRPGPQHCCLGLIFHQEASLADFYHSQILDGVRQAAQRLEVDLMLLRYQEQNSIACDGYLFVNPLPGQVEQMIAQANTRTPILVVGARPQPTVHAVDVDNVDLAIQAVEHLKSLGHTRIGYVGGADELSNSADRWQGFCQGLGGDGPGRRNVLKAISWRLSEAERMALFAMLSGRDRPTALFVAGYDLTLEVYTVAVMAGLKVPEDLSVVGVDDPPSAAHLSPALTTLRQPLGQMGQVAVATLAEQIRDGGRELLDQILKAQLVVRRSVLPR